VCQKIGEGPVPCETSSECTVGACIPLAGQGFCLSLCQPSSPPLTTTSLFGTVVERRAGAGQVGSNQPPKETPLADVDVCLEVPRFNLPCARTGANGKFELGNLPPNRAFDISAGAVVSFTKTGYLPTLRAFALGEDNQTLIGQVRLFKRADADALADSAGAAPFTTQNAWVTFDFTELNRDGTQRISVFEEGGMKLRGLDQVRVQGVPASGRFVYPDASEAVSSASDAGAGATSIAGSALLLGAADDEYTFTFTHPTLKCGAPALLPIPAGWVSSVATLCGPGTR
jgi:hypothetical protein